MTYKFQSRQDYLEKVQLAKTNLGDFWNNIAKSYVWQKQWNQTYSADYKNAKFKWFSGAKLNITENCLDRHLAKNGDKIAIIFEANEISDTSQKITYNELKSMINKSSGNYITIVPHIFEDIGRKFNKKHNLISPKQQKN